MFDHGANWLSHVVLPFDPIGICGRTPCVIVVNQPRHRERLKHLGFGVHRHIRLGVKRLGQSAPAGLCESGTELNVTGMPGGCPPTHVETIGLFGIAGLLPPVDLLDLAHLRYLRRLIKYCPAILWSCMFYARRGESSWFHACEASCRWFRQFYPHPYGPSADAVLTEWFPYVAVDTKWKGRLKAAAKACIRLRQANAPVAKEVPGSVH